MTQDNQPTQLPNAMTRLVQQSMHPNLSEHDRLRICLPTCFYILAKAYGYLEGVSPEEFIDNLDQATRLEAGEWSRPKFSRFLRQRYGIKIVSWWTGKNRTDLIPERDKRRMHEFGYLDDEAETDFFWQQVVDRDVAQIVQAGHPVIATVLPGFGQNRALHSIILARWADGQVDVIDPDDRNPEKPYPEDYIRSKLNPNGACSIILPKNS
ncbi:MAG TPA: hypothetical protein VLE72_03650 [Candidatus Saccharimonadales bacterium]|nr:hypothetical protein [Candidatus Saccharimonadales bacterium]